MKKNKSVHLKLLLVLVLVMAVFSSLQCQDLPDPLLSNDNMVIESSGDWEKFRREEVLELFRTHVYGRVPESLPAVAFRVKSEDKSALSGRAVMKEIEARVSQGTKELIFTILVFLPSEAEGAVPLFLGLNFNGNHCIHPSPEISITDSWVAVDHSRGMSSDRWPLEMILARGYGLASIYYGDIDPDFDDGFENGIHAFDGVKVSDRDSGSWGSIAAWAWALSRAMDYFETDRAIDQDRVAVLGHSRLGKTSLWAGAQDERFAMVISNNSGCGGAALSRRPFGESVESINKAFPHWFASRFHEYGDKVAACPLDQHMLLALMAPRPLYVASAEDDEWADPVGEYLSLTKAGDVYRLYDEDVLKEVSSPGVNRPRWAAKQGYHIRTGKHDITRYDWDLFLDFADVHLSGQ